MTEHAPPTRQPYAAPELRDYGTVQEVTLAGGPDLFANDNVQIYGTNTNPVS